MSIGEEKSGAADGGSVGRRRRRWSEAQKRQIVAETHEPGVSVPMVAQRYNLNANQIFRWRRLFREPERAGGAGRFAAVVVEAAPGREAVTAAIGAPPEEVGAEESPATGRIEIVLNLLGPAKMVNDKNILMDVTEKYPGITHVSFRVASIEATKQFLAEQDIPLSGQFSFKDLQAVFIRDPDRNVIELDAYAGAEPETRGGGERSTGYDAHP